MTALEELSKRLGECGIWITQLDDGIGFHGSGSVWWRATDSGDGFINISAQINSVNPGKVVSSTIGEDAVEMHTMGDLCAKLLDIACDMRNLDSEHADEQVLLDAVELIHKLAEDNRGYRSNGKLFSRLRREECKRMVKRANDLSDLAADGISLLCTMEDRMNGTERRLLASIVQRAEKHRVAIHKRKEASVC